MSNSRLSQFLWSKRAMAVQIDLKIPIGATGAVGTIVGPGVSSVVRTAVGVYKVKFLDNYNGLLAFNWASVAASAGTGGSVTAGSFVTGTTYVITALGNSTFGDLPAGITAAVGMIFTATGAGAGTGTAKAVGQSGITQIELLGAGNMLAPSGVGNIGGTQYIQCLAPTNSSTTTLVQTDPTNTSVLYLKFLFTNSSLSPSIQ